MTSSAGTSTPIGTVIKLTALTTGTTGLPKFTTTILGTIECNSLSITGKLVTNSGGTVTFSSGGLFTSANCTNNGNPTTVTSLTVTDLVSTVSGKGAMSYNIVMDQAGLTCTFTGTSIPFTYSVGGSVITFNKAGTVDGSPAGCGNATLDAEFTVEQETTGGTFIDVILD